MLRVGRAAAMAVGVTVALVLAPPIAVADRPAGPEDPGVQQGTAARVRVADNRYRPATLTVERGTRVRWRNVGQRDHTVTADGGAFDSGFLAPGERFARRFRRAGTFDYHCTIHPRMSGTIQVV